MASDFNGDGRDDIFWRDNLGIVGNWLGRQDGRYEVNYESIHTVPSNWTVVGTGDFNGDNRDDILWRNEANQHGVWLGTATGDYIIKDGADLFNVAVDWFVGPNSIGDFNGDGQDDLLWSNETDGSKWIWYGLFGSGGFKASEGKYALDPPQYLFAVGDFNGDGQDDWLWKTPGGDVGTRLADWDQSFPVTPGPYLNAPAGWDIVGIGDFNGDGRDDILWRHQQGAVGNWLGTANGGFINNAANSLVDVPNAWQVWGIGDYNGDGRDDLLWRHEDGRVGNWLGEPDGGFFINDPGSLVHVPLNWRIQPNPAGSGEWDYF